MKIARKAELFGAGLLLFLMAGSPVTVLGQGDGDEEDEDSGLTCAWCVTIWDNEGQRFHVFIEGGEECGWEGHDVPRVECVRCGGTSTCHAHDDPLPLGECHRLCGPAGDDVAVAFDAVSQAVEREDVVALAAALRKERDGFTISFLPDEGRIVLALECSGGRPYHAIPVLPRIREALHAQIEAYGQ